MSIGKRLIASAIGALAFGCLMPILYSDGGTISSTRIFFRDYPGLSPTLGNLLVGTVAGLMGSGIGNSMLALISRQIQSDRPSATVRLASALGSGVIGLIVGAILCMVVANFVWYPLVYGNRYPGDAQASGITFFGGLLTAIFAIVFGSGFVPAEPRPPIES